MMLYVRGEPDSNGRFYFREATPSEILQEVKRRPELHEALKEPPDPRLPETKDGGDPS